MNFKNMLLTLFSAFFAAALAAGDYALADLKLDRAGGIYKCGDEVIVTGRLLKGGKPVTEGKVRVVVKWECKEVETHDFHCDGKPFRVSFAKGDRPGWVYFGIQVIGKDDKVVENPGEKAPQGKKLLVAEIGAIYEPEKLRCSYPTPEDSSTSGRANARNSTRSPSIPSSKRSRAVRRGSTSTSSPSRPAPIIR